MAGPEYARCAPQSETSVDKGAPAALNKVVVMLVPQGQEEMFQPVIRAVQSQLSDIDVVFRLKPVEALERDIPAQVAMAERVARDWKAIAVFWCDLVAEDQIFLYLTEYEGDRILVRKLREKEEGGRAEALAIIVRTSISEMLKGGEIGVRAAHIAEVAPEPPAQTKTAPPTKPPPPPTVEAPPSHGLAFHIAYAFLTYSADNPATHGLDLGLEFFINDNWALIGGYTVLSPIKESGEYSGLRLKRHPGRLGVAARFPVARFTPGASLFLVIDVATFENFDLPETLDGVKDRNDVIFGVMPMADLGIKITDLLSAFISAGAEVQINPKFYVTEANDELLDSWPVHVVLLAGFSFRII